MNVMWLVHSPYLGSRHLAKAAADPPSTGPRTSDMSAMRCGIAARLPAAERARADAMLAELVEDDRRWRFPVAVAHGDLIGPRAT